MKVSYRGDLLSPSGYSRAIRAHIRALLENGVEVCGDYSPHDQVALDLSAHAFWAGRMNEIIKNRSLCPIKIWHETPEFYSPDPTQYNVAYVVWETSHIIQHDIGGNPRLNWVKQINTMDEVWTASEFNKKVFKDSGVTVPINVFPHPIDIEEFCPGERVNIQVSHQIPEGSMVFLSVFQFTKRKNPHDLIVAWTAEFGNQEDVALIIKTYGSGFSNNDNIRDIAVKLRKSCRVPDCVANMHLMFDMVPDEDMAELYRAGDVFVLASYGEGFGMPYQEAMACGLPVIYTDASSMPEFCVGWPVECDPEPVYGMPNIPWYDATQDWWRVRVGSLRRQLRAAYNAWKMKDGDESTFRVYQEAARQRITDLHTYATVGRAMRTRLEEIHDYIRSDTCRPGLAMWLPVDSDDEVPSTPSSEK